MKSFHLHLSIFNISNNFKFSKALCASDAEPLCTGQQMYEFSKVKKNVWEICKPWTLTEGGQSNHVRKKELYSQLKC